MEKELGVEIVEKYFKAIHQINCISKLSMTEGEYISTLLTHFSQEIDAEFSFFIKACKSSSFFKIQDSFGFQKFDPTKVLAHSSEDYLFHSFLGQLKLMGIGTVRYTITPLEEARGITLERKLFEKEDIKLKNCQFAIIPLVYKDKALGFFEFFFNDEVPEVDVLFVELIGGYISSRKKEVEISLS